MAWMYAVNDDGTINPYKGDSGSMSNAERLTLDNKIDRVNETKPLLGYSMVVGSPFGRSYANQDYWITTPVTKILEEYVDDEGNLNVIFKTKNSKYHWKRN